MSERGPSPSLINDTIFSSVTAGSAVFLLALLIVAGRMLGDEDYGKFSFALALATIFETFTDFGLKEITTRSVARDRGVAHRLIANTLGLKLALATLTMLALVIVVRVLHGDPVVRMACYLLGGSAVLRSYLFTVRHLMTGLERFDLESVAVVTDRLLLLGLGTGALLLGHGVSGLAFAFLVARLVSVSVAYLLAVSQIGRLPLRFDFAFWRELQLRALPFGAFITVFYLYSYIDMVILNLLRGNVETGLYGAAYRLYEGLSGLPVMMQLVLIPKLARYFITDRARHARVARTALMLGVLLAVPVAGGGLLLARPAITLLFGQGFVDATGVFRILSLGLVFVFPLFVLHAEAISTNAELLLLRMATIGCASNIVLNLILIPPYGMHGAAAATVASEFVSVGVLFIGLRRSPALGEAAELRQHK